MFGPMRTLDGVKKGVFGISLFIVIWFMMSMDVSVPWSFSLLTDVQSSRRWLTILVPCHCDGGTSDADGAGGECVVVHSAIALMTVVNTETSQAGI